MLRAEGGEGGGGGFFQVILIFSHASSMTKSLLTEGYSERMVMPLWRSLHALNLMLPKEERKAMLLRLYNEVIPLQDNSKARFEQKKEKIAIKEDTVVNDTNGGGGDGERDGNGNGADGQEDLFQAIIDATSDEEAGVEERTVEPGLGGGPGDI